MTSTGRRSALAELKALREGGGRRTRKLEEKDDTLYDELSEEDYKSVVRGRLMEDDFIEDDDGSGYVDNGMDDWDHHDHNNSEDEDSESPEEYFQRTGRKKPKKKKNAKSKSTDARNTIGAAFSRQPARRPGTGLAPSRDATKARDTYNNYKKAPNVSKAQEEDFMANLLGGLDSSASAIASPSLGRKRKPTSHDASYADGTFTAFRTASRGARYSSPTTGPSSDPAEPQSDSPGPDVRVAGDSYDASDDIFHPGPSATKKMRALSVSGRTRQDDVDVDDDTDVLMMDDPSIDMGGSSPLAAASKLPKVNVKAEPEEDVVTFKPIAAGPAANSRRIRANAAGVAAVRKPVVPVQPKAEAKAEPSWVRVHESLNATSATIGMEAGVAASESPSNAKVGPTISTVPSAAGTKVNALEPDGTLRMFWIDYLENDGIVYLVGKVQDKDTKKWVSCCLTVNGIERNLFVLPRTRKFEQGHETDIPVSQDDVYDEFDKTCSKANITERRAKWVTRKYAFELRDVPQEAEYLKVVYSFKQPQLPLDVSGSTFSRVFGTNTSAFELFALKRRIMGPCWLEVKSPLIENENKALSWCKLEASVSDPKDVNPFPETDPHAPKGTPPLTIMSLSARTVVNHKENKRELVCASTRVWHDTNIDDPAPPETLPCSVFTAVRPLGSSFPAGFEKAAKQGRTAITTAKYERMVLNQLLAQIYRDDPDVIVGHDFCGVTLDVLLARMRDLKAEHWSRIGRFRRAKWPKMTQGRNLKLLAGRLVCDLASDNSKSMISSTTWSLSEMVDTHLKLKREDIDPDETAEFFDSSLPGPDRLLHFVRHCEVDTYFQMAIANRVQILPLTKQLTNLAGNSWNRTLNSGRAERNEYILLHDFHRRKFICPDKVAAWEKREASAKAKMGGEDGDEDSGTKKGGAGKKDKFKGGLVFEPKRGLWDKYILVMDFNSLYPSIIQEFNIDFTTVDRSSEDYEDVENVPEVPSSDVQQGVLPGLIATLVNRRRQVKSLMKDRTVTPAKLLQYDIKQMALKLTANSMYGCLGFENSRFYARPLAALTTFKGREILTHTKELAESLSLDVIYGDTDSVMINTNATDLADAMKIGNEFKKNVNDRYRLLEIDIDGVFQRMLLLQKKKYAALKVDESGKTSTEIKGLDMKRREYSKLSKDVSELVLGEILSGEPTEVVVEKIHDHLTAIGSKVREGAIPFDDFIIYKRLGKDPGAYPDARSQPHVQVAMRMLQKGNSARAGDVIPYIFCLGEDGTSASKTAQADRAFHPDDLRRKDSTLKIDFEHYLSLQILPPVERLCESIEGTDRARLAECLGLDPSRYQSYSHVGGGDHDGARQFFTLESQMSDKDRFRECEKMKFRCRSCKSETLFGGLLEDPSSVVRPTGLHCPSCAETFHLASLRVQLDLLIRAHIARYYEAWQVCDEPSCGARTRMIGVYPRRCLVKGCKGRTQAEYGDRQLYDQLVYWERCFDGARARDTAKGSARFDEIQALESQNRQALAALRDTVQKYLDKCGRRYVSMASMFQFMLKV